MVWQHADSALHQAEASMKVELLNTITHETEAKAIVGAKILAANKLRKVAKENRRAEGACIQINR